MNTQWILDFKDKISEPIARMKATVNGALENFRQQELQAAKASKGLTTNIMGLREQIEMLKQKRDFSFNTDKIRQYNGEIRKLESQLRKLENLPPKGFLTNIKDMGSGLKAAIAGIGFAGVAAGVRQIGGSAIEAAAAFEKYEAVLTNTFGSRSMAINAMNMIKDFASKTPFQVDKLTESYVKLANRGFVASRDQLTAMGDLAASTGKDFDQLVEAILDAETGEFERLKEFGIKANKQGDQVTFSWKGVTKTVQNNAQAVREAFIEYGKMKGVAGTMESVSKTVEGMQSNLSDTAQQTLAQLGDLMRGLTVNMIGMASSALEKVRALLSWIKDNKSAIADFFQAIVIGFGAAGLAAAMYRRQAIATFISTKLGAISAAAANFTLAGAWRAVTAAMAANPIGVILVGVTLLITGLVMAYKKFDWFKKAVWGAGKTIYDFFIGLGKLIAGLFNPKLFMQGLEQLKNALTGKSYKVGSEAAAQDIEEKKREEAAAKLQEQADELGVTVEEFKQLQAEADERSKKEGKVITPQDIWRQKYNPATQYNPMLPAPGAAAGGKGAGSSTDGSSSDRTRLTHVTIHIAKLFDKVEINTTKINESYARVEDELVRVITSATNSLNKIATAS